MGKQPKKDSLNEKKQKFALPTAYSRPQTPQSTTKMSVTMKTCDDIVLECTKIITNGKKYKNYHMPPSMAYALKKKGKRFQPPSVVTDTTTQVTATSCSDLSGTHTNSNSNEHETDYTELECETEYATEYKQSEVTEQCIASSSSESSCSGSSESTYFDETCDEDQTEGTFVERSRRCQSKTRITNDGMKDVSIGIKSDVLEQILYSICIIRMLNHWSYRGRLII